MVHGAVLLAISSLAFGLTLSSINFYLSSLFLYLSLTNPGNLLKPLLQFLSTCLSILASLFSFFLFTSSSFKPGHSSSKFISSESTDDVSEKSGPSEVSVTEASGSAFFLSALSFNNYSLS